VGRVNSAQHLLRQRLVLWHRQLARTVIYGRHNSRRELISAGGSGRSGILQIWHGSWQGFYSGTSASPRDCDPCGAFAPSELTRFATTLRRRFTANVTLNNVARQPLPFAVLELENFAGNIRARRDPP